MSVLGHIQQGGEPSPFDRILGIKLGVLAIDWLDTQLNNFLTDDGKSAFNLITTLARVVCYLFVWKVCFKIRLIYQKSCVYFYPAVLIFISVDLWRCSYNGIDDLKCYQLTLGVITTTSHLELELNSVLNAALFASIEQPRPLEQVSATELDDSPRLITIDNRRNGPSGMLMLMLMVELW